MRSFAAIVLLTIGIGVASGHETRIFPIARDGSIPGIPKPWGPVNLKVDYLPTGKVSAVRVKGSGFSVKLSPCALEHLPKTVVAVEAGASWDQDLNAFPPYLSVDFIEDRDSRSDPRGQRFEVTFSLLDGHVLMAQRIWKTWWGGSRNMHIDPARSCTEWDALP